MSEFKVLFAEDSPTMRRIIINSLKSIGFSNIIEAENGVDALNKLEGKEINLVITDWNMPEMNGKELVKNLRQNSQYKNTPILMITTRGMKDDVLTAIRAGVNGYVVKPFTLDILREKIENVLGM